MNSIINKCKVYKVNHQTSYLLFEKLLTDREHISSKSLLTMQF